MVKIKDVRAGNQAQFKNKPLAAVFIGATSGIGNYTVTALARLYADNGSLLRAYVVGRSTVAWTTIQTNLKGICPDGTFIFLPANDLTSIRDVDKICEKLIELEQQNSAIQVARIDLMIMTQGKLHFGSREGQQANTINVPLVLTRSRNIRRSG